MKYKKLIECIEMLRYSEEDCQNFLLDLEIRGQNTRQQKMFNYLLSCRGNYEEGQLEDERLLRIIANDQKPVHEGTLRDLAHELVRKIEDFLCLKEIEEDELLRVKVMTRVYKKRGSNRRYINTTTKSLEKVMPDEEMAFHFNQAEKHHDAYFHPGATFHHKKEFSNFPRDARYHMTVAHAIFYLKTCAEDVIRKKLYKEALSENFEKELAAFLVFLPHQVREIPLVNLFEKSVRFLSEPTIESYQSLKIDFIEELNVLQSEKKALLSYLMNGLGILTYKGSRIPEHYDLIKIGLQQNLFVEHNSIAAQMYINIVSIFSSMYAKDEVNSFVMENEKYLRYEGVLLDNIKRITHAYVFFTEGNYLRVRAELRKIKTRDMIFSVRKYVLDIMAIFELIGTLDLTVLLERCRNFQDFIRKRLKNEELKEDQAVKLRNFIELSCKIADVKYNFRYSKTLVKVKLENMSGQVSEELWLHKKIQELR